jgi:FlaA1/EpsC-like NDP-sugar epimerase
VTEPAATQPSASGQMPATPGGYLQVQIAAVILDVFIVGFSTMAAYAIRFGFVGMVQAKYLYQMMVLVPVLILARVVLNALLGVYRVVWRYVGLRETLRFVRAVAVGSALLSVALLVLRYATSERYELLQVPIGIIILEGTFTFVGVSASRFLPRILAERGMPDAGGAQPALLVGAGRGGLAIAREAALNPKLGIRPVGFVDDDPAKIGKEVHGLRVYGALGDLLRVIRQTGAGVVVITTSAIRPAQIWKIMDQTRPLGYQVGADTLRAVHIEDLLSRDPVPPSLSMEDLTRAYGGKRILVTGAGGSIGSELCRQLVRMGPAVLLLCERDETNLFEVDRELGRELRKDRPGDVCEPLLVDICDTKVMAEVFRQHRPDVVFHAAAYKHVPMMERFPHEAVRNNVFGTLRLAELADRHGVSSFVMISTDKAVRPSSVMGATKRLAEMAVQQMAASSQTSFSCVRFGNVLGSRGSVVSIFRRQIQDGGPVTVTHPGAMRYFMTVAEAAHLVIQAGTLGSRGEVFLLDMGEPVKIIDLARQMILLSGATETSIPIEIVGTRPGEKLFEELKTDAEKIEKTPLRKIYRCSVGAIDGARLQGTLEQLEFLVRARDGAGVRACLRALDIDYREAAGADAAAADEA